MKKFTAILMLSLLFFYIPLVPAKAEEKEKVIYLTFDDGPGGKNTTDVLDILKKENVHATFFVIGEQIKGQEATLKRMVDEGHSIGLHSMTHKQNKLYSSNENFLNEMLQVQLLIKEVTGVNTNILRFPFGCNNNCYHLNQQLVDLLHDNNLKIFDWNTDSTDGAHHNANPSTFIKNAKSDKDSVTLLMHCGYIHQNSVKALPEIIKYYKDNGYTFKTISEDTPEVFHFMKKH